MAHQRTRTIKTIYNTREHKDRKAIQLYDWASMCFLIGTGVLGISFIIKSTILTGTAFWFIALSLHFATHAHYWALQK